MDRSATDTIKGYFYQFDYSILNLLTLSNLDDTVQLECIEDIDIHTANDNTTAIQCKYYAKSEYNHSVIKEPIMFMLTNFANNKTLGKPTIKYFLKGHYKSGQEKLKLPIDIDFLKKNFLTYVKTENINDVKTKVQYFHHTKLNLNDNDLEEFLNLLQIDINGQEFDEQYKSIINNIKSIFKCSEFTAEHFFYNCALRVIKEISIKPLEYERIISKQNFLKQIDKKVILFNEWFLQIKGIKAHWVALRKEYFSELNISPYERFFLIESDNQLDSNKNLVDLVHTICRKYSKLSLKEPNPFCPYIFFYGLSDQELIGLKNQVLNEGLLINDGYPFLGSKFNFDVINKSASFHNGVKVKILSHIDDVFFTLNNITKRREIYQFYLSNPYLNVSEEIKHIKIQVNELSDIKQII